MVCHPINSDYRGTLKSVIVPCLDIHDTACSEVEPSSPQTSAPRFIYKHTTNQYSDGHCLCIALHAFHDTVCSNREWFCPSVPHHPIISSNRSLSKQTTEGIFTPLAIRWLFMPHQWAEKTDSESWARGWQTAIPPPPQKGRGQSVLPE